MRLSDASRVSAVAALFGAGLGLLVAAACSSSTAATPAANACVSAGGKCLLTTSQVACGGYLPFDCTTGYTCCTVDDAGPLVDAGVEEEEAGAAGDALAEASPSDAPQGDASDGGVDAAVDGRATKEASVDAHEVTDAGADAHGDAPAMSDAGHDAAVDAQATDASQATDAPPDAAVKPG